MPKPMNVVFVCHHGAARSVIAAELLRRLADERGQLVRSSAFGLEPDAEIPPHVVAGLRSDGVDISDRRPEGLTEDAFIGADQVVAMGCDVTSSVPVVQWDDIPAVSDGYDAARTAIVARLEQLLLSLQSAAAKN